MSTRTVFMGSPEFSLAILEALIQHYSIVGVVTQPDRPAGRGRALKAPPVKEMALQHNLPVIQPHKLNTPEAIRQLNAWAPDLIVVAAYGQILRPEVLDLPPHGCVNVHASLLPRWRGAAPINAAILHGDSESGITIMQMDPGLDSGPIISQQTLPIRADETAGSLFTHLARLGAKTLVETLPAYLNGEILPRPQNDSLATYAPMLHRQDGELDFSQSAEALERRVRAFDPWPGTYFSWGDLRIKVHRAQAVNAPTPGAGTHLVYEGFPAIGTPEDILVLNEVQPAGKQRMAGDIFLRGAHAWA